MRCINCYQEIPDDAKFCPQCGAKQPVQKMAPVSQVNEDTTTQNVTDDAAEVQQQAGAAETSEEVKPSVETAESAGTTEAVEEVQQPEKPVEVTGATEETPQPEQATDPYQNQSATADPYQNSTNQNDPYSSQNNDYQNNQQNWYGGPQDADQGNSYGGSNNYQYGQGYNQQNQNYNYNNQQNQGYYQQNNYNGMAPKPVNWVPYLVLSILSTLCCCLPFGVVGIVFSAKINSSMAAGNYEEAQKNAKMARIWIIVSFVLGIITWAIYMLLIVTGTVSGSAYYYY